jgi:hypothetical protein
MPGWLLPGLHVRLVPIWPSMPGWLICYTVDAVWFLLGLDAKLVFAGKRVPNFGLPGVDARLVLIRASLAPTDNAHQESFVDLLAPAHKIWKEKDADSNEI